MANQNGKGGNSLGLFMATLAAIGLMLCLAFLPQKAMTAAWNGERAMAKAVGGERFDEWVMAETYSWTEEAGKALNEAAGDKEPGSFMLNLAERAFVAFVWFCLIVYRAMSLMVWGLVCIPFILAVSADGFYVREIRKESFIAQSPVRHKFGAWLVSTTMMFTLVWLFVPVALPPVIAPALMITLGAGLWVWVSNLQKRI